MYSFKQWEAFRRIEPLQVRSCGSVQERDIMDRSAKPLKDLVSGFLCAWASLIVTLVGINMPEITGGGGVDILTVQLLLFIAMVRCWSSTEPSTPSRGASSA